MAENNRSEDLDEFWDKLLSRQPKLISIAFNSLGDEERRALIAHLLRMRDEEGWHPEQRLSAIAALQVIGKT